MIRKILLSLAAVLAAFSLEAAPLRVSGMVRDGDGHGVAGVKVTDGFTVVKTGADGSYDLQAHDDATFVYVSIPSGFETQIRNGAPLFYRELDRTASWQVVDFEMARTGEDETRHEFFVWADVQVNDESQIALVKDAAADAAAVAENAGVPSFGITCGDLVESWSSGMSVSIQEAAAEAGFPFFILMGNHDCRNDMQTTEGAKTFYQSLFGPTYYSFDKGQVHYVVLDDVFHYGRAYMGYLGENQLDWLKADIADVPAGNTVVVFLHIPTYSVEARNGDWKNETFNNIVVNRQALYQILKPYNAHICSAHEHYAENYQIENNLMEHVSAPLSGLFWQSLISCDGLPWGYYVYEVNGSDISWYYKAVGKSKDVQFSAYRTGEDPMKMDCIVANVWDYDSQWKVEWSENGKAMGSMERFAGWDRNIVTDVENRAQKEFKWKYLGAGKTEHLFFAKPESSDSDIQIKVTDRFGNVYTWNSTKDVYSTGSYSITSDDVTWNGAKSGPVSVASNSKYGTVKGANRLETSLYDLAVAEMVKDIEPDGTFRTGEKWTGVWTRDVSYSAILSLAHLEPEVIKTSLLKKVDRKGRIIQDTGTGGAWPCSTDREVWAIAAWEVYLETGDMSWLRHVYPIIKRSLEADMVSAYDSRTGLFRGESSFIDWRIQSYPKWMQCVDISQSECLGTNAVFYRTFDVMSKMATTLGGMRGSDAKKYAAQAESLKKAINDYLWMENEGYYAQYMYGRISKVLSPRSETLGESLCILWGIASDEQAARIMENMPVCDYGPTIFAPQISATYSYHNNAIWPFVTSFYGMAAAKVGNRAALMHAIGSNERAAAAFGSNMENMVASTGTTETALDSPRQLWSIGGYIGLFREALLGINYGTDGIHFSPAVPASMKGLRSIKGMNYRKMTLDVSVCGEGSIIKSFKLDGNECEPFVSADLEGSHAVEIQMVSDWYAAPDKIRIEPLKWDVDYPRTSCDEGMITWAPVEGAVLYKVLKDGSGIAETADTVFIAKGAGEYSVIAVSGEGVHSFMSEPLRVRPEETIIPLEVTLGSKLGSQAKLEFEIAKGGVYELDVRYSNGNGSIETFSSCATRTLYIDRKKADVVVMPQRGDDWKDEGWTNPVRVELSAGKHTLEIRYLDENINMSIDKDVAVVHSIRLTYKNQ